MLPLPPVSIFLEYRFSSTSIEASPQNDSIFAGQDNFVNIVYAESGKKGIISPEKQPMILSGGRWVIPILNASSG